MASKTSRTPSPSAQLSGLLSRFPAKSTLAKKCLAKLRTIFPGTLQLVYDYPTSVVVSFGLTERGAEAIAALAIYPAEVRLYFNDGKLLPDPKGLLKGSATRVRYVNIDAVSDMDQPDIKNFIKAAIKQSGARLPRRGDSHIVIKSEAKKKRAKAKKHSRSKPPTR
jgi:hypothetical protein